MITAKEIQNLLDQAAQGYLVFEEKGFKFAHAPQQAKPLTPADTKSRILVTGGAGYIGAITARMLSEQGLDVIVLDNLSSGHKESVKTEFVEGDLNDQKLLDKIFEDNNITAVVHFAGFIRVDESVREPDRYFGNNVGSGLSLLNTMARHGVKNIVYSSSAAVYGNPAYTPIDENHPCTPVNPYGETKLIFEKILDWYGKVHGFSSVSFRYFNAAGAAPQYDLGENHPVETHLIPKILDVAARREESLKIFGSDYPTFDGTAVRDYVHVLDIAKAHVLGLNRMKENPGTYVYNIGTGRGSSINQMIDAVMEVTRKMIVCEKMPRREGDPAILVADSKKVQSELGLTLENSDLRNIIATAWEWHKKLRT